MKPPVEAPTSRQSRPAGSTPSASSACASFSPPRETKRGGALDLELGVLVDLLRPACRSPGTRPARTSACACARLSASPRSTSRTSSRFFMRHGVARSDGATRRRTLAGVAERSPSDASRSSDARIGDGARRAATRRVRVRASVAERGLAAVTRRVSRATAAALAARREATAARRPSRVDASAAGTCVRAPVRAVAASASGSPAACCARRTTAVSSSATSASATPYARGSARAGC